jgi:hypothetical protein
LQGFQIEKSGYPYAPRAADVDHAPAAAALLRPAAHSRQLLLTARGRIYSAAIELQKPIVRLIPQNLLGWS